MTVKSTVLLLARLSRRLAEGRDLGSSGRIQERRLMNDIPQPGQAERLPRTSAPALDEILGTPLKVLDEDRKSVV